MRRRFIKSDVKCLSSTEALRLKLIDLSVPGVCGTASGAVKCVDIGRNTSGEGGILGDN